MIITQMRTRTIMRLITLDRKETYIKFCNLNGKSFDRICKFVNGTVILAVLFV